MKFEIIENDVWGDEENGYWVNQGLPTGQFIELSENVLYHNDTILKRKIKKAFFIKPGIHFKNIVITGDPDFQLDIDVKGYPVGQLNRIK